MKKLLIFLFIIFSTVTASHGSQAYEPLWKTLLEKYTPKTYHLLKSSQTFSMVYRTVNSINSSTFSSSEKTALLINRYNILYINQLQLGSPLVESPLMTHLKETLLNQNPHYVLLLGSSLLPLSPILAIRSDSIEKQLQASITKTLEKWVNINHNTKIIRIHTTLMTLIPTLDNIHSLIQPTLPSSISEYSIHVTQ